MPDKPNIISLTVDVVSAFVGHNNMRSDDVPAFIAATIPQSPRLAPRRPKSLLSGRSRAHADGFGAQSQRQLASQFQGCSLELEKYAGSRSGSITGYDDCWLRLHTKVTSFS
jgi:hypothetical protein